MSIDVDLQPAHPCEPRDARRPTPEKSDPEQSDPEQSEPPRSDAAHTVPDEDALIRRDVLLELVRQRRAFEALKDQIHLDTFGLRSNR